MRSLKASNFLLLTLVVLLNACSFKNLAFKKFDIENVKRNGELQEITGNLRIENPNNFHIRVKRGHFKVANGPVNLGDCKVGSKVVIPKKQESFVPLQINLSGKALVLGGLQQIGALLTGGNTTITIDGELRVCTVAFICKNYKVNEDIKIKL